MLAEPKSGAFLVGGGGGGGGGTVGCDGGGGGGGRGGGGRGDGLFPSPEFSAGSRLLSSQWVFCPPLWTWTHNSSLCCVTYLGTDKTLLVIRNSCFCSSVF